jgi:hypothetical protein
VQGFLPETNVSSNTESSTASTEQNIVQPSAVVPQKVALEPRLPKVVSAGSNLQVRQLWEGTVVEIEDDGFIANLIDRTKPSNPEEQAKFEFQNFEVPDDDKPLVKPGFPLDAGHRTNAFWTD